MSARGKRVRGVLSAAVLLGLAAGAAGVLVGVGDRYHARVDVTTTGEQRLAPRTEAVLGRAAAVGEVEIVVAVDAASIEPWSRRAVRDVLDLFDHAGGVRTSEIDVGSAAGQAQFGTLLDRLLERERDGIDQHVAAVQRAAGEAAAVADAMRTQLAPAMLRLGGSLTAADETTRAARTGIQQWAQALGQSAQSLTDSGARAEAALSEPDALLPIPPLTEHEAALRASLDERAADLETLAGELGPLAGSGLGDSSTGPAARAIVEASLELRDRLARQSDLLGRLPRLDVLRVARALGSAEVALVIGPPGTGVTGIDIGSLYEPTVVATDGTRVSGDVRFQAEELLGSAVAAVLDASRPIVVLVHGESQAFLDSVRFFDAMRERLHRRGIDMAEWVASRESEPPRLTELDPDGVRPVVYVALSPNSSAAAQGEDDIPGPERAAALGRAISTLIQRREPVLINVNPSILPSYGEADPVVSALAALGVKVESGTPILGEAAGASGRRVLTELSMVAPDGDHPIQRATRGLRTVLSWPIAIRTTDDAAVVAEPLLVLDESSAWAESQWLRLWQTPANQRALLPDAPAFDPSNESRQGPWTVAAALSRPDLPEGSRLGRVVVIGSNSWWADPIAAARQTVDGRVVLASPGNAELFEAAVLWLAGEDELIAASAGARASPLVRDLQPGTLSALRWSLVAGLPIGTLLLGLAWRLLRG